MALQSLLAPLRLADFENVDGFRNLSPFEMLLKATERDSQTLKQERAKGAVAAVAGISRQEQNALKKIRLFGHEFTVSSPETEETHVDERVLVLAEKSGSKGKSVIVDEQEGNQSMRTTKQFGSKRRYESSMDEGDEERVSEKRKPCKKQRKNYSKGSCSRMKIAQEPEPTELPEGFKNMISEIGGTEATLLLHKTLFASDISEGHGRLLMPLRQMKTLNFLLNTELQELENGGCITVPIIWPSLQIKNIVLKRWDMHKSSGRVCPNYVLRTSWNKVVKAHELKVNDAVQVWSFRVQGQLNLALVKVI